MALPLGCGISNGFCLKIASASPLTRKPKSSFAVRVGLIVFITLLPFPVSPKAVAGKFEFALGSRAAQVGEPVRAGGPIATILAVARTSQKCCVVHAAPQVA